LGVEIRAEVAEALGTGAPVVALESTLISHGLPRPDNQSVAREAERAAHAEGAIPATGGLGGVHREASESWDVSADLATLARTPVTVVCSGVKSILDVPATLEHLETLGVPVVGFRTERFPGFYLTDSGSPLDWAVEDEGEAARLTRALPELGFERSGLVVANPIHEGEQLDPKLHDRALRAGLKELKRRGVRGKEVTTFLLDYFGRETKGESVRVNKEIILHNARIAVALSALDGAER
jgi:pseudouridine-5'-phosphate glycosidase